MSSKAGVSEGLRPLAVPVGPRLEKVLTVAYRARRAVLLEGPTGVGKSEIIRRVAEQLGIEHDRPRPQPARAARPRRSPDREGRAHRVRAAARAASRGRGHPAPRGAEPRRAVHPAACAPAPLGAPPPRVRAARRLGLRRDGEPADGRLPRDRARQGAARALPPGERARRPRVVARVGADAQSPSRHRRARARARAHARRRAAAHVDVRVGAPAGVHPRGARGRRADARRARRISPGRVGRGAARVEGLVGLAARARRARAPRLVRAGLGAREADRRRIAIRERRTGSTRSCSGCFRCSPGPRRACSRRRSSSRSRRSRRCSAICRAISARSCRRPSAAIPRRPSLVDVDPTDLLAGFPGSSAEKKIASWRSDSSKQHRIALAITGLRAFIEQPARLVELKRSNVARTSLGHLLVQLHERHAMPLVETLEARRHHAGAARGLSAP